MAAPAISIGGRSDYIRLSHSTSFATASRVSANVQGLPNARQRAQHSHRHPLTDHASFIVIQPDMYRPAGFAKLYQQAKVHLQLLKMWPLVSVLS